MKGSRIKQLREEYGLTQIALAEKLQISNSAIAMYETDKREASDDIKIKMAEFFNCSVDYLVGKTDIRNQEKVNENDIDVAFAAGIKGLNKENQEIAKSIIEGLLAKQNTEDKKD